MRKHCASAPKQPRESTLCFKGGRIVRVKIGSARIWLSGFLVLTNFVLEMGSLLLAKELSEGQFTEGPNISTEGKTHKEKEASQ